jgi:hypothetical protein
MHDHVLSTEVPMDPTTSGANAMRLAPGYDPPTRPRRNGAQGRTDAGDEMPAGPMDADAGAESSGTEAMGGTTTGEMPRGEMQGDAPEVRNRLVGMMEGDAGASEMPTGGMSGDAALPTGAMPADAMPAGAMSGGMGAANAANAVAPGPDGMPSGTIGGRQDGAKPGETTPNRATLEGAVGGLTIRGEWRLTLSSISTGSDG